MLKTSLRRPDGKQLEKMLHEQVFYAGVVGKGRTSSPKYFMQELVNNFGALLATNKIIVFFNYYFIIH